MERIALYTTFIQFKDDAEHCAAPECVYVTFQAHALRCPLSLTRLTGCYGNSLGSRILAQQAPFSRELQ